MRIIATITQVKSCKTYMKSAADHQHIRAGEIKSLPKVSLGLDDQKLILQLSSPPFPTRFQRLRTRCDGQMSHAAVKIHGHCHRGAQGLGAPEQVWTS